MKPKVKVFSLVVLFQPDEEKLQALYASLIDQVEKIYFICNSPYLNKHKYDSVFIDLPDNVGIAAAQNFGIKAAIKDGADYIFFSDQDSCYPPNYVETILNKFHENKYEKIAAISPLYRDQNKNNEIQPIVFFEGSKLKKVVEVKRDYFVSHVISSGMICEMKALLDIGLYKEEFFIDWVDTEWCWRALDRGYKILQTPEITMDHAIGNKSFKIFGRMATTHSVERNYYKIRNIVYLLFHSSFINLNIKRYAMISSLKMIFVSLCVSNKNMREWLILFSALKDGAKGKLGKRLS